ncbi:unnamed protein product [Parnassius apollo]|uniref:(apollo) hypothetical protein n=1 Tax=Parnassius apollo TaxID=110799 RepID=A0A8S3WRU4_PARAO|nr:unnamed protein product [Parnassius apollo]
MPPEMKLHTISKLHICENCLYVHKYECNSEKRCKECNKKHNTLLHDVYITKAANNASPANMTTTTSKSQGTKPHVQSNHVAGNDEEILLATIKMQVRAADGSYIILRALLDQGSQTSLISENAAQRLGLKRQNFNASVTGIGTSPNKSRGKVLLHCKSLSTDYAFSTEALIMSKVINCLPVTSFENKNWPHIQHLQLADPEYNISKPIDILLDAKVYAEIIMDGLLKGSPCQPIAQQTQMGWILSGSTTKTFNCYFTINNIEDICNYWEMEDISEHERSLTLEEQFCEDYYVKTTKRLSSGVYEVRLPMKKGFERQLGNSKLKAVAQFKQLERKLGKRSAAM